MQVKDFEEIENNFNTIDLCCTHLESLSKSLFESLYNDEEFQGIEDLTDILHEKIADLKSKFDIMQQGFTPKD